MKFANDQLYFQSLTFLMLCVRNEEFIVIKGYTEVWYGLQLRIHVSSNYGTELNFETQLIPE